MLSSRSSMDYSVKQLSTSRIEFQIPSKVTGDYNADSCALTPHTESDFDEFKASENVTPFMKWRTYDKSRQSPQPSQMFSSKLKKMAAENITGTSVSPAHG